MNDETMETAGKSEGIVMGGFLPQLLQKLGPCDGLVIDIKYLVILWLGNSVMGLALVKGMLGYVMVPGP